MEVPVPNPEIQRSCIWHRFCLFPRFFGWNLELFPLWLFCIFVFYFIIQELTWDCYFLTWDCYFLPWDWYFLIWDCYFSTWDCYYFFYLCLLTNSTILLSVRPFWTMTVDVTFILGCASLLYRIIYNITKSNTNHPPPPEKCQAIIIHNITKGNTNHPPPPTNLKQ